MVQIGPTNPAQLRSLLSAPASNARMLERALESAADSVILDLEDAVAVEAKAAARAAIIGRTWYRTPDSPAVTVRVNAPRTPWCHLDLLALCPPELPIASILVPKVESAGDLAFVERLLDGAELAAGRTTPIRIDALIESAAGLANVERIARSSTRLRALIIGYADLSASLGRDPAGDPSLWLGPQDAVLTAARANGLFAVDGPYLGTHVDQTFRAAVDRAAALGFDGKWVIHPRQLEVVLERFTPSPEQCAQAQRVIDALDEGLRTGRGAVALDGRMIDEAVAIAAHRTLEYVAARSLPPAPGTGS
ncbi:HpcH/HpaI aldolase/citrate lyase family protein [Jatrophihabitans sp. DSM 45814]